METKCEFSTLTIPNDDWYAGIASKYVGEVAEKIGFDGSEREKIELGVSKALTDLWITRSSLGRKAFSRLPVNESPKD